MAYSAEANEGASGRGERMNGCSTGNSAQRVPGYRGLYTKHLKDGMDWYYLRSQKGGNGRWINLHTTDKKVAVRRYHQESISVANTRSPGRQHTLLAKPPSFRCCAAILCTRRIY